MQQPHIDPMALASSPRERGDQWGRLVLIVMCLIALGLALYLTTLKLTGRISDLAGCGGEGGCESILGGRWANWMLVPVSVWAVVAYVPLLILAFVGLTTPWRRRLAMIGVSVLVGAAIWFVFVQAVIERQFCPYCFALHSCGVIAFAAVLRNVWSHGLSERAATLLSAGVVASISMAVLIAGQVYGPQRATHEITSDGSLDAVTNLDDAEGGQSSRADATANTTGETTSTSRPTSPSIPASESQSASQSESAQRLDEPPEIPSNIASSNTESSNPASSNPKGSNRAGVASSASSQALADPLAAEPGDRVVRYFGGAITMPVSKVPLIGRPDARHILLKYFDYTCPACRRMHDDLATAIAMYPNDIAVIVIPCPLNASCNPYVRKAANSHGGPRSHEFACEIAKVALAVWRADPKQFQDFHDEMFARQGRMTPVAAQMIAESKIGSAKLRSAMTDPWIDTVLKQSVEIYGRMKRGNPRMPKLLLGGRQVLHGVVADSETFLKLLRQRLQLAPPDSSN